MASWVGGSNRKGYFSSIFIFYWCSGEHAFSGSSEFSGDFRRAAHSCCLITKSKTSAEPAAAPRGIKPRPAVTPPAPHARTQLIHTAGRFGWSQLSNSHPLCSLSIVICIITIWFIIGQWGAQRASLYQKEKTKNTELQWFLLSEHRAPTSVLKAEKKEYV